MRLTCPPPLTLIRISMSPNFSFPSKRNGSNSFNFKIVGSIKSRGVPLTLTTPCPGPLIIATAIDFFLKNYFYKTYIK